MSSAPTARPVPPVPRPAAGAPGDARPSRRLRLALLLLILALAAALRIPAIPFGDLGRDVGTDEGTTMWVVGRMLAAHEWNTHFHKWPNLNVYLSAGAIRATRWLAYATGRLPVPPDLYIGRATVTATGILTVLLVYLAAARPFGPAVALLASAFVALAPLHLERSRHWLTDCPMTLCYTLALWLSLRILERPSALSFALAGAAVGLAVAGKYNGVGAAFLVMAAAAFGGGHPPGRRGLVSRAARLALAGVVSLVGFVLADPYALLDFRHFRADFALMGRLYTAEPGTGFLGWHGMVYVLGKLWTWGLGPLLTLLAGAGLVLLGIRRTPAALVVCLPPFAYLVAFNSSLRYPMPRNFLLLVPHLAIAAAVALVALSQAVERAARRRWPRIRLAAGLQVAALVLLLPAAVGETFQALQLDTRDEARSWIHQNLPPGSRVHREWPVFLLDRNRFHSNRGAGALYHRSLGEVSAGSDYIVVASTAYAYVLDQRRRPGFAERARVYDRLFSSPAFELVARFVPGLHRTGPEIRVYRNLANGAPELDGRASVDLASFSTVNTRRLLEQRRGDLEMVLSWERLAGSAVVPEAGRYALTLEACAERRAPLVVGLDRRARRYWIEGETRVVHEAEVGPGLVWWRIEPGNGFREGDRIQVRAPTLRRAGRP